MKDHEALQLLTDLTPAAQEAFSSWMLYKWTDLALRGLFLMGLLLILGIFIWKMYKSAVD